MASNGGTLHGGPQPLHQPSPGGAGGGGGTASLTCSHCGLLFDSGASLQVHMHYHHDQQQQQQGAPRWQSPSSTNSGNNSPPQAVVDHNNGQADSLKHTKSVSPPVMNGNTITSSSSGGSSNSNNTIAAADSSDNQPATPSSMDQNGSVVVARTNAGFTSSQELNYYQQAYDQQQQQHYQPQYPPAGTDYPGSTASNNNLMMQPPHEYKASSRYHPYSSPVNSLQQQQQQNTSPSTTNLNSASPRIVSSSSPNHHQNHHLGQPTPSPSPKQCDKCGLVCSTVGELNDHYVTVHSSNGDFSTTANAGGNYGASFGTGGIAPAVKDEPACDILDLDSQKMVYPPHHNNNDPSLLNQNSEGPLPSMQSLHTIQRHPHVLWGQHPHPADMYHMQHQHQQQQRGAIDYGMMSPVMKSEYVTPPAQTHLSSSPSSGGVPSIKSEYMGMSSGELKPFDQSSGSITTSPSDFPTTTTPQDSNNNNTGGQFRTFEPPTSSLPAGISPAKSTAWKSNEARRPKTYNCTACNKWFTSSGHLKRHYNTTLHKNAVKASNQPDPATMPISVHHHPARDPNSKHHRNSGGGGQGNSNHAAPPQPPPTDPQRSPDYAPQFASAASVGGYTNAVPLHGNQGFQQYSASLHSTAGIPPNGQAGPSVHASLPRGLLTYSTNHHLEVQPVALQHHTISSEGTTASMQSLGPQEPQDLELVQERDPLSLSPNHSITTTTTTLHRPLLQPQHSSPSIITTTLTPIISSSMGLPPLAYISSPLGTITTTTSPPSRPEVIQQPLSYHTIIGSQPLQSDQSGSQHSLDVDDDTDGMIIRSSHQSHNHHHHQQQHEHQEQLHQQQHQHQQLQQVASETAMNPYEEYAVSSASDMYTIRVLANGQDIGDTAPYSPSMPHDPFKQQPLQAMSAHGYDRRIMYMHTAHGPEQAMIPLPKFAETAPELVSPGSPSVTSSDSVLMHEPQQQKQRQPRPQQLRRSAAATATSTEEDVEAKKYQCIQCDKTFNKSCYLTQHNKTFHSGEKPFKCHRCGKRFSCEESHEEHVAKHSGDKPFKCELCPKAFNHKTDLRRHMCLHSGRKPFHCDQCGKGFIRKDHLVKHMDVHTRKAEQMKRKLEQQPGEKGHHHQASKKIKLEVPYDDEDEEQLGVGEGEDSSSLMM